MTRRLRSAGLLAGLLAILAAAGCIQLGEPAPAIRYWVLYSIDEMPEAQLEVRSISVGPVDLPAHLDRPSIVRRVERSRLLVSSRDHWGEPLRRGIARVVSENLTVVSPGTKAVTFPWTGGGQPDFQVSFAVTRLDASETTLTMVITWVLRYSGADEPAVVQTSVYRESIEEDDPEKAIPELVAATSRALKTLSREIAEALDSLPVPAEIPGASAPPEAEAKAGSEGE